MEQGILEVIQLILFSNDAIIMQACDEYRLSSQIKNHISVKYVLVVWFNLR